MLLVDLVKLFSTNFNIDEERFLNIIDSNNIKLAQRLLVKIKDEKKNIISEPSKNEPSINEPSKNEPSINEPSINEPSKNEPSINEPSINEPSNNEPSNNESSNNESSINEPSIIEPPINESSKKKTTNTTRGRGRPRKTKEFIEENDVVIEVELVTIDNKEYYMTRENVLMTKDLEVSGVYVCGVVYACPM